MSELFSIKIGEGFPADKAIKKFKRLSDSYGVVREYRNREAFKKPSVIAKEKLEANIKRIRKNSSRTRRTSKI